MKTKNGHNMPIQEIPSFVYRQDGSELSYLIWLYYSAGGWDCQDAANLYKNFTVAPNENLYNGGKIRYTESVMEKLIL